MLIGLLARIFRGSDKISGPDADVAWRLYRAAVDQARSKIFYTDYGVADSIDGRFDLIILHVILLVRRFRREGEAGAKVGQALFDSTFADMDRSLREMGVGDLGVGRRVKAMAKAFYGRAEAYDTALDSGDQITLFNGLKKNVFGDTAVDEAMVEALGRYVAHVDRALADQPSTALVVGDVVFDAPPLPVSPS
jgi:cytochrome b pre-mRNA-processing protein 3